MTPQSDLPAPRRSPLLVIFLTVFLDLLGFGIIIPVLPFYAEQYGASEVMVTLLGASYSAMQFIFAPMWGRLSDRVGRRPIILMGVAMSAVGYLVFGMAESLWLLFAARILAGIGNANISTAQAYIADVTSPQNRARGMGLIGMAFGLGFIFGPTLGTLAAMLGQHLAAGDPNAVFNHVSVPAYAAATLAVIDVCLAAWLLPESLPPEQRGAPPAAGMPRRVLDIRALAAALRQPVVGTLLVVNFTFVFGWANVEGTFGLLLERMFVGPGGSADAAQAAIRLTGVALTIVGVGSAVVQGGLIGRLTRRFGERRLLLAGLLLQTVALSSVTYAPSFAALVPVLLLMAVANGLATPSMSSMLSRNAAAGNQGLTMGMGQSLSALARTTGPVWGGALFQWLGYHAPYLASAVILLVSAAVAVTLPRPAVAETT